MFAQLTSRREDDVDLDVLVWRLPAAMLVASTAQVGGGLGAREWVLNAQVPGDYQRVDIEQHVGELAATFKLRGDGVGMLTAAQVRRFQRASCEGVDVEVTVGLSHPTWAASDETLSYEDSSPGTINSSIFLPVPLDDGALLNALATATEAKSQALFDAGIPGTGTPSDALTILCPLEGSKERFAGPRSVWGSRLARAVHAAVLAGAMERPK
jgi:adenosylcobinamide amidohydrolase